jgi:hypothetical protein
MKTSNDNKKVARSELHSCFAEFARLYRSVVDPYRPELHYMRGPGPKWRAKYAPMSAEVPQISGLAHLKG